MTIIELFLIAVGLASDAFVVSITLGLKYKYLSLFNKLKIALTFSILQVLMPMVGFLVAYNFNSQVTFLTKFIAFLILSLIGINMLISKEEELNYNIDFKNLFFLGIATSLDAFAVGLTIAFLKANMVLSLVSIGLVTFILCFCGVLLGNLVENHFTNKARIMGGIILILIGLKILIGF